MVKKAPFRKIGWRLVEALALSFTTVGIVFAAIFTLIVLGWLGGREYLSYLASGPASLIGYIAIIAAPSAIVFFQVERRLRLKAREHLLASDLRPPVLYLRPFAIDSRLGKAAWSLMEHFSLFTEEEQLIQALSRIGPVIAIGRPGEFLPPLGARREYVSHAKWKVRVEELMREARL